MSHRPCIALVSVALLLGLAACNRQNETHIDRPADTPATGTTSGTTPGTATPPASAASQ